MHDISWAKSVLSPTSMNVKRVLILLNVRRFFHAGRNIAFVPLTLLALAAALWPYIGSPFAPLIVALILGLEPVFANILFGSSREFEAYALGPVSWEQVVLAKNIAAMIVALLLFVLMSLTMLYTLPDLPTAGHCLGALCCLMTILFPLLHVGNGLSVRAPRRVAQWSFEDVARAFLLLAYCGFLVIPYFLLMGIFETPLPSLLYAMGMACVWYFYSVPATARMIRDATTTLSATR
jgi:hypothetical protein